jgi:hypothetical protein
MVLLGDIFAFSASLRCLSPLIPFSFFRFAFFERDSKL